MARHDREESLEEQLAWLDAIKETDEAPVTVSATVSAADESVSSPYPKDPWLSVPAEHDTPTPPLFRAAVDSVYGEAAAQEPPAEEAEPEEWLEPPAEVDQPTAFVVPPASLGKENDAFLAPLKPLPRPDDTDYSMGAFGAAEKAPESKPERSLFDPPPPREVAEADRTDPAWAIPPAWSPPSEDPQEEPEPAEDEVETRFNLEWPRPPVRLTPEPEAGPQVQPQVEPRVEVVQSAEIVRRAEVREAEPYQPRRRQQAPVPVFNAPPRPAVGAKPTAESLDPESLLRGRRNAPSKGWRRIVYKASAGWIKPGEPADLRRRRELMARARTPVATGHHRVAVLSLKGGVGKTTTTVGLGATLAQVRGDRVIAVDANPDRGTLSDKLELETSATVRDLLNERDQVKRYVDIRAFTSQAASRLEVLASDRDPSVSEAFSASDYQSVAQTLENFYSICITDCGTGLLHSAMSGVLGLADQIVLVSSPSVDGARAASATLDWLEAHHYGDLVREATVVLCSVRPRSKSAVDIRKLEAHFAARCRAVIRVPYDPHLEEGAEIDLDRLQEATRESYLQLAACVGDGFAGNPL